MKNDSKKIWRRAFQIGLTMMLLYNSAAAQKPLKAEDYYRRGAEKAASDNCEEAVKDFTRAIRLKPREAQYFKERGDCFHRLLEYPKALADLNKAIELKPDFAEAFVSRGQVYTFYLDPNLDKVEGYDSKALDDFDKAIELNPKRSQSYIARANFFLMPDAEEPDKALADLAKAIELNPVGAEAYLIRIGLYKKRGEYEKAIADHTTFIEKSGVGYDLRAETYAEMKKYELAIADYNTALKTDPNNSGALSGRAKAYRAVGKVREAEADERKFKTLFE